MTSRSLTRGLSAALFGAILFAAPVAQAQSSRDKVVSTLVEVLKAAGAKEVTYGSVSGDDAKFTLKDIKVELEAEGKSSEMTVASATYSGASVTADGGFKADSIDIADLSVGDDETEVTVDSWKITNYVGQGPAGVAASKGFGDRFDAMDLTGIEVDGGDMTVPIYSIAIRTSEHVAGIPRKATVALRGLVVPVDPAKPEAKELADLGYKEVAIDFDFAGGWDEKAQRLSVDTLTFNGKNMGALSLAFAFGNVTADAMKALQEAGNDNAKQIEILQGFSIETVSLRFVNASLVDRMLDAQAKKQGTSRDKFVTGIAAAIPLMIGAIGNPEFEKKLADAVGTFLKAPKSLALVAKPAQPVPVAQVVGTAMVAPQTLPGVLAVDVQANK